MRGNWGTNFNVTLFGESHGEAVGVVLNGVPAGLKLDLDFIRGELQRRAPGKSDLTTPRKEKEEFRILSGYFNEHTTGSPLSIIIENANTISSHYNEISQKVRPGHADFTGFVKYNGFNDYRGGGHFSGRITVCLVLAGAVAKQILKEKYGLIIGAHIKSIGEITAPGFDAVHINVNELESLHHMDFPVLDEKKGQLMQEVIRQAKAQQDSVGGIIECAVLNLPAALGEPFFGSVESVLSSLLFSIPAVKGVEFGDGFAISKLRGSEANDSFYMDNGQIKTVTNHNGGINGGISNGMPLVFRTAIKPTPSISLPQKTVDIHRNEDTELTVIGRHDPCILPRAVVVVECAAAIGLLELDMSML